MNNTQTASDVGKTKGINQGLLLEYATLSWNVIGVVVVLFAAAHAGSVALFGFGLDSLIEIFASVIVVWQLKRINKDKEAFAERLIGFAFFALAIYITAQAVFVLYAGKHPHHSTVGLIWLGITALVMFSLAYGKQVVGKAISNPVLQTEAKVTYVDAALAVSVFIGLALNALFHIWYADIIAAGVIVYYGVKEGLHAIGSK